jgi:succinate dehydrogenase/fumarate reductase flavoprotein subunit
MHEETVHCDVLVIGSGASGLAAAITADVMGLDAIVCEASPLIGGASAISGGEVWVPLSRQAGGGRTDSREAALTYLGHVMGELIDRPRVETYVDRAAEALAFLEDHSLVRYELLPHVVDYYSELPGATAGLRSLGALPFDGRQLGTRFTQVRPPLATSMILGGMSVGREDLPHLTNFTHSPRSALHVSRMLLAQARDRLLGYPRGTRMVMGNALIGRLMATVSHRDIPLWLDAPALELLREDGRIVGAMVRTAGRARRVRARRGVVIAGGGFSGSVAMQHRHFPHVQQGVTHRSHLPESNDGSVLELALDCGATMDDRIAQPGAWTPVSTLTLRDGTDALAPHFGDRAKPGVIVVDSRGRRFANEALNYHRFVQEMIRTGAVGGGSSCYLVTSHRHLRKYGLGRVPPFPGRIRPFLRSGYLVVAGSLGGLASQIGVQPEALEATVREFDTHATAGKDPQFGKGNTAYERAAGDPDVSPNPCVAPLGPGPYYAVRIMPGDIGTLAGLKVDARARALDGAGDPLPGLYAVGTAASSIMGGTYPAAGSMLGPALTFGYLAALDIVAGGTLETSRPRLTGTTS